MQICTAYYCRCCCWCAVVVPVRGVRTNNDHIANVRRLRARSTRSPLDWLITQTSARDQTGARMRTVSEASNSTTEYHHHQQIATAAKAVISRVLLYYPTCVERAHSLTRAPICMCRAGCWLLCVRMHTARTILHILQHHRSSGARACML